MATLLKMLQAHPRLAEDDSGNFAGAVETLGWCEQACLICADACLAENNPAEVRRCIQQTLDCAAICRATAIVLLRRSLGAGTVLHAQLLACIVACQACFDECAQHAAQRNYCTVCADLCSECQEACNAILGELAPGIQPVATRSLNRLHFAPAAIAHAPSAQIMPLSSPAQ